MPRGARRSALHQVCFVILGAGSGVHTASPFVYVCVVPNQLEGGTHITYMLVVLLGFFIEADAITTVS